jgi:antitoxin HigA-1
MDRGLPPIHPFEILREDVFPALDKPKTEIARLLGISRETLYRLLREEQSVTPDLAARIGKLCGNGPGLWLRLQADYDTHKALQIDTSHIPTLKVA